MSMAGETHEKTPANGVLGVGSGEIGIRTLDTDLTPYNGLANRRLQPLGHLSGDAKQYQDGLKRQGVFNPWGRGWARPLRMAIARPATPSCPPPVAGRRENRPPRPASSPARALRPTGRG